MWSRFFILLVLLSSTPLLAAELININTATLAELDTLPGVGPATAQSIIDNRPYAAITEISRASGIGELGSSSYENIKDFITVGAAQSEAQSQTQQTTQTETQTTQSSGGGAIPPALTARIEAPLFQVVGAGAYFSGSAYNAAGEALGAGVRYMWNFGDGATAEGKRVFHVYTYPSRYAVRLEVAYGYSAVGEQYIVEVTDSTIALTAENDGSLLLRNSSEEDVDVGLWRFVHGERAFVVPEHTLVLAGEGLRFAPAVTGIVGAAHTSKLLYPNGTLALVATPAINSPLRGERVPATAQNPSQKSSGLLSEPRSDSLGSAGQTFSQDFAPPLEYGQLASAAAAGVPAQLGIWAALLAVLGVGVAGVYYSRATAAPKEEFDIEHD